MRSHSSHTTDRLISVSFPSAWKSIHGDETPPWSSWIFSCSHEYVNSALLNKRIQPQFVIPFGQRSVRHLASAYSIPFETQHLADKDATVLWQVMWNVFAERAGETPQQVIDAMILWAKEKKLPESAQVPKDAQSIDKPTCVVEGCKKRNIAAKCTTRKCKQHCLDGLDPCKYHKKPKG